MILKISNDLLIEVKTVYRDSQYVILHATDDTNSITINAETESRACKLIKFIFEECGSNVDINKLYNYIGVENFDYLPYVNALLTCRPERPYFVSLDEGHEIFMRNLKLLVDIGYFDGDLIFETLLRVPVPEVLSFVKLAVKDPHQTWEHGIDCEDTKKRHAYLADYAYTRIKSILNL